MFVWTLLLFIYIFRNSKTFSEPCTKQPLSFGVNCSLVCHCLEDVCDARTDGVGCKSGSCSPGYTGFPSCQESCVAGKFGINCESNCLCEPMNICEATNGNCIGTNKCNPFRFGPGCQNVRARLLTRPMVTTDCTAFEISWPGITSGSYTGSTLVVAYSVLYKTISSPEFVELKKRVTETGESIYNVTFAPANRTEAYSFSIRPDFRVQIQPDYYIELGVPSELSPWKTVQCPALVNFRTTVSGKRVVATWRPYNISTVHQVKIIYRLQGIGDCKSSADLKSILVTSVANMSELISSQELDYWRHYSVEAFGVTSHDTQTDSTIFSLTTPVGVPLGTPVNLRLINSPNETHALVTWEEPVCELRQGPLKQYVLELEPLLGVILTPFSPLNNTPPLLLSALSSKTTYTLRVAYENAAGIGPKSAITFQTKAAAYPSSIRFVFLRPASTIVAWSAPEEGHNYGNLTSYHVNYWPRGFLNQLQSSHVLPNQTYLELNRLKELTDYELQVFSIFGTQRFGSPVASFRTLAEDVVNASLALHLLQRTSSTITVTWTTNRISTEATGFYKLAIALKQSLLPSKPTFNRSERTIPTGASREYTFKNLPASSEYEILIQLGYSAGSFEEEATLSTWTFPAPFSQSSNLQFGVLKLIERTGSTATVRYPAIQGYEGGPLNGFQLIISPTSLNLSAMPDTQTSALLLASTLPSTSIIVHHSNVWPSEPIVIGSGDVSSSNLTTQNQQTELLYPLGNPPLESNMSYIVFAMVHSVVNGSIERAVVGTVVLPLQNLIQGAYADLQTSGSTSAIVGGVLGVLLILTIVFALLLLIYSRGWCKFDGKHGDYSLRKCPMDFPVILSGGLKDEQSHSFPKSHAWWSVPVDVREPRYLIVDPDQGPNSTLVGTWSKNELAETFAREFASIPVGYKYPHSAGNAKENLVKNRVQTVLPYNHNRVILKRKADSTETDYINASFIDGYMRRRAYIAAQSPFDTPTASDFWLMIFQRNCTQIVMLTNLVEDGTLKCCQYWPDPPRHSHINADSSQENPTNCSQRFGDLIVQSVDTVSYAHFTVRQFHLIEMTTGDTHNVTQYHFHSWISSEENVAGPKANGAVGSSMFSGDEQQKQIVPSLGNFFISSSNVGGEFDRLAFIEFYYRVKTASRPEDGPVLVHCGTGLTRTGLYIAFDSLLQQATHERVVGVARFCASLCKSRANMLCSSRHYMLLYDLLFEALVAGHSIVDLDVLSTYRILNQKNPKLGRSYLWEQWSMLHLYTPSPDPEVDLRTALAATNAHRNRFAKNYDLLPAERWRPHFRTKLNSPDWTGYINAVYIDGTSLRDDLILTQTPCANTMDEFWLLIDEEKISCIIDMEPFGYGTLDAVRYWPLRIGEVKSEPLFEGSSDDERNETSDHQSDTDDSASVRSPWFLVAGGQLQICQVGSLTPVRLDPGARKRGSVHGIYRRRLLIRSRNASGSREKPRAREVLIFHYASDWNKVNQVPESRVSLVRLLETVRLERGTGPLLVHCLDGATRSGLFAVSHLLAERMTRDHYVDLFHVIKAVKVRRRAVIASQEQLRFVYRLLAQWIKQTLAEPLAAWTSRRNLNQAAPGSTQNWQWPQLVGHLPPYARVGIFTHSQLPALVADHSSAVATAGDPIVSTADMAMGSCPMLNSSNSITEQCPSNNPARKAQFLVPILYRYFHDELLNQRSTYSLKFGHPVCPGAAGDFGEMNSWSDPSLDRFNP